MNPRMLIRTAVLAAVLAQSVPALSAPGVAVEKHDFAAGIELDVPRGAPVVELPLPASVYAGTLRNDLGDLRVFNAAGNAVPHGLAALNPTHDDRRTLRIAAFAIDLPVTHDDDNVSVTIERDARGVIRSMRAAEVSNARTEQAYILPVTGTDRPYTSIRLEWRRPRENFVQTITLEGSDDLKRWTLIEDAWLIANLRRGSSSIRENRLAVPSTGWKYLRVRAVGDVRLPQIRTAVLDVGTRSVRPELEWTDVALRTEPQAPGRYFFDVPRGMHMRSIEIAAPVDNAYARVRLRRKVESTGEWTNGTTTPVYRLQVDAGTIRNRPLPVRGGPVRHWSVDVPDEGRAFDGEPPSVRIGWLAHTLVFVARGEGPFVLAYGSATAESRTTRAQALLAELQQPAVLGADGFSLPRATVLGEITLGGEQALSVPPPPTDWNRIILWVVLVAAVLVLLMMAVRLLREERPD